MSQKYDNYDRPNFPVEVEQRLVTYGYPNRSGEEQIPKYIVIHEVSLGLGKSPENFNMEHYANKIEQDGKNGSTIGYHFLVGDKKVFQFLKENEKTDHTGTYQGNRESIGVERLICKGVNYEHALHNQAKLIATLMVKWNIPIENVVTHKRIQEIYNPAFKNYELNIDNFENLSSTNTLRINIEDYLEELNILKKLKNQLPEDFESPVIQEYNKCIGELEIKSEDNNPKNLFENRTPRRNISNLYQIIKLQNNFKRLICKQNNLEYVPLKDKIIGNLHFKEELDFKDCPNRLLIGQRGGLIKFYREIEKCLENKWFFEEILEQQHNLKK